MPRVSPFRVLEFDPAVAGPLEQVTAPPYDVISESSRRDRTDRAPHCIVRVDLAEGSDDPEDSDNRYARAAALLRAWRREGVLVASEAPELRAYEMATPGGPTILGLLCAIDLRPWGDGVLPHEEVMEGPVDDRLRLLRATHTHLSPVYGTVPGPVPSLARALETARREPPSAELTDRQGVRHRMWSMRLDPEHESAVVSALLEEPLLVADGHHRYTTALRYQGEMRRAAGPGPWDQLLVYLVDESSTEIPVLPYHRLQLGGAPLPGGRAAPDLGGARAWLDDERGRVAVLESGSAAPDAIRLLELPGGPPAVSALHRAGLDEAAPGDLLAFTHDTDAAISAARDGSAAAVYLMPPTTPEHIRSVVEAGARLPRKSTYFWPKPRTGMVLMPLEDQRPHARILGDETDATAGRPEAFTPPPARAS